MRQEKRGIVKVQGVARRSQAQRNVEVVSRATDTVELWARRHFAKYGDGAVNAAVACRREGLRDLVVAVGLVAETIPALASRAQGGALCTHGQKRALAPKTSWKSAVCGAGATLLVITDSGLVSFYCAAHAESAVGRMPR